MNNGLYICPGAPATCSAAVRAIWLARPGTSVSKVRAKFRRLREGSCAGWLGARGRFSACETVTGDPFIGRTDVDAEAGAGASMRAVSAMSSRTGLPARSDSSASMRPAFWLRIQSSL